MLYSVSLYIELLYIWCCNLSLQSHQTPSEIFETKQPVLVRVFSIPRVLVRVGKVDQSDVDRGFLGGARGMVSLVDDEEGGSKEAEGGLSLEPAEEGGEFLKDHWNHVRPIHLTTHKEVAHSWRKDEKNHENIIMC